MTDNAKTSRHWRSDSSHSMITLLAFAHDMIAHFSNPSRFHKNAEAAAATCAWNLNNWREAVEQLQSWQEYEHQPLWSLPAFAQRLGIKELLFKDESKRFGKDLACFKALGAPYALYQVLAKEILAAEGRRPSLADVQSGKHAHITRQVTVCVSTDGNQGRALAWGANLFGCPCVIYINKLVGAQRAQRMIEYGAIVIRVDGDHKVSVDRAREDARMNGWHFVSSVSLDDYQGSIAQDVVNAYMTLVEETIQSIHDMRDITHVLVCCGMGSVSARIFLGLYSHLHELETKHTAESVKMPRFIVLEPLEADCLLESAKADCIQRSKGSLRTVMACLACREPSPAAFKIHQWLTSDFVAVPDQVALVGMRALAEGRGDVPIVCGESSAAAVGLLIEASHQPELRDKLGLHADSRVLSFGLEGATDLELYEKYVGMSADVVFQAQAEYLQPSE